jgi:hypothetical protein
MLGEDSQKAVRQLTLLGAIGDSVFDYYLDGEINKIALYWHLPKESEGQCVIPIKMEI